MKRWGDAHMEFLSVLPDIRELAKTSPSKRSLYATLRKAKKISMSYTYFCQLIMRHSSFFPLEEARKRERERQATQERMAGQAGKESARPAGMAASPAAPAATAQAGARANVPAVPAVKPSTAPAPGEKKGLLVVGRRDERVTPPAEEEKEEEWL